jgi:hypothetical protein
VPDNCIGEFADFRIKITQFTTMRGENWRANLVKTLDFDAELIFLWVDGSEPFNRDELQRQREILERYGVQRRN